MRVTKSVFSSVILKVQCLWPPTLVHLKPSPALDQPGAGLHQLQLCLLGGVIFKFVLNNLPV